MDSNERFRLFLVNWKNNNWNDNQSNLAKHLGLKRANLSNILSGKIGTSEESRKKICGKIGINYWEIIKPEEQNNKTLQNGNVIKFPEPKRIDPKLESMRKNLDSIFESGDEGIIAAIEANLKSFQEIAELKKTVSNQAGKMKLLEDRLKALEGSG